MKNIMKNLLALGFATDNIPLFLNQGKEDEDNQKSEARITKEQMDRYEANVVNFLCDLHSKVVSHDLRGDKQTARQLSDLIFRLMHAFNEFKERNLK